MNKKERKIIVILSILALLAFAGGFGWKQYELYQIDQKIKDVRYEQDKAEQHKRVMCVKMGVQYEPSPGYDKNGKRLN